MDRVMVETVAEFDLGVCRGCGERIEAGEEAFVDDGQVQHADCPGDDSEED